MTTITSYLQQNIAGVANVYSGVWVRLHNNNSGVDYVSTAATDGNGKYTVLSVPPGSYSVFTGPSAGNITIATGDTDYLVPLTVRDDAVLNSVTLKTATDASPFSANSLPSSINNIFQAPAPNGTDDTTAIQNMLNGLRGTGDGIQLQAGTYKTNTGWSIPISNVNIKTAGAATILSATAASITLLKALNVQYLNIEDMWLDGGYLSGVAGLVFDGVLSSRVGQLWGDRFLGDTQYAAQLVMRTSVSAIQNTGRNVIEAVRMLNGGRGIVFSGRGLGTVGAPNNLIHYVQLNGRGGFAATVIDFVGWCDNNTILYADIGSNFTGSTDIILNSGVPGSPNGVYEIFIWKAMIGNGAITGEVPLVVNNTERTNWIGARFAPLCTPVVNAGGLIDYLPGSRTAGDVTAQSVLRSVQHSRQAPAFDAAPVPDFTLGEQYEMAALTAGVLVQNPANPIVGQRVRLFWRQDGVGGRTVGYNGTAWRSVGIVAQVTTANTYTIDEAECLPGNIWRVVRLVTGQTV